MSWPTAHSRSSALWWGLKLSRTTTRCSAKRARSERSSSRTSRQVFVGRLCPSCPPAAGLGRPDVAVEPAGGGVVGGEQVAAPGGPRVGRPEPDRVFRAMPAVPEPRLEVQGAELIEAEYARPPRRVRVQVEDRSEEQ